MTWSIEVLHRDGAALQRILIADPADNEPRTVRIGRALDNDLIVDDAHCAAHHAEIVISGDAATLSAVATVNGIIAPNGKAVRALALDNDKPFKLGHTSIRVRCDRWPLAPELPLQTRPVWPLALLLLGLVFAHESWDIWLKDVGSQRPEYLYTLAGVSAGLGAWSSVYTLFGRLVSGTQRFFHHLAIACTGFLSGIVLLYLLDVLAFASSWLWPIQIHQPVVVVVGAATVRAHLRLADPRHWPGLRYAVALVAALAIVVPIAQQWMSHSRWSPIESTGILKHPALRLAPPVSIDDIAKRQLELKNRTDALKAKQEDGDGDVYYPDNPG
ncbi:MAG: FHA domain-containing protein [Betaproteobacteria bacterium]|nr:FHA domain-containing protein [Betaproteobacteria bacterium]